MKLSILTIVAWTAALLVRPSVVWAQFYNGDPSPWRPNGVGTLDHEDDLRWVFFHDAKITADYARGECRATFPPPLAKENGVAF